MCELYVKADPILYAKIENEFRLIKFIGRGKAKLDSLDKNFS